MKYNMLERVTLLVVLASIVIGIAINDLQIGILGAMTIILFAIFMKLK